MSTGPNGQVDFDGSTVTIHRKGLLAKTTFGGGETVLAIRQIAGVEVKPAGLTVGWIRFIVPGMVSQRGVTGDRAKVAAQEPNTVTFNGKKGTDAFQALASEVQAAIASAGTSVVPSAHLSIADELAKFAALRDQGILTEEEFQSRKAALLT